MFEGKKVKVLLAQAGAGKALDNATLIPTPKGLVALKDIKVGDYVFSVKGKPTKVLGVYPQGEKEAYKVTFSDGRSIVCCLEHLWSVYTRGKNQWKYSVEELGTLLNKGIRGKDKREKRKYGQPKFYIPASPVCEYETKELPINPYVLGSFLGHGCLTLPYFTISSKDEWQVNKVAVILGYEVKRNNTNYSWTFYKNGKIVKTSEVFPSELCSYAKDKYIPSEYIFADVEQRRSLLCGLFDTDGSVGATDRCRVSYSTTSKRLCKDIQTVLLSLGIVSTIREDKRKGNVCYELHINCSKENKELLFSLPRKKDRVIHNTKISKRDYSKVAIRSVEKLNKKVEMTCLYVEDAEHLFLAGDFIVTHNTHRLIQEISKELEHRRPEEIAFVTFTRKGAEEGLRRVCNKLMLTPDDLPYFKTLHSLTFHALDFKANQMFSRLDEKKFNKEYGYNLNRNDVSTGKVQPTKDTSYLDYYDLERSGALTSKQIVEADIEVAYYHQLVQKYEEYKSAQCLVDFFDCLIKYVQFGDSLPCKVVMIDECFSPETKVRMADMTVKEIKDIKVGDYVMGTKGATKVISVCKGKDVMYDVMAGRKQKLFTCNSKHLILQKSKYSTVHTWKHCEDVKRRAEVFASKCTSDKTTDIKIDPYFFGLWLGNGFSREAVVVCNENDKETINYLKNYGEELGDKVTVRQRVGAVQVEFSVKQKGLHLKCNVRKQLEQYGFMLSKTKENEKRVYKEKIIPEDFFNTSIENRLSLLAGLIDSDGMYVKAGKHYKYRIEMSRKKLMSDIYNLIASLGYLPSWYETEHTTNGVVRKYYRIDFFGSKDIPCLLKRKQFKTKPYDCFLPCRTVKKEEGDYVGITVDAEDNLFLLANGCVVHNCQDITALQWKVIEKAFANAEEIYLVGDENQCIYRYNGARPDFLINFAKQFEVEYLPKSHRLPRQVYNLAKAITDFIQEKTDKPFLFKEGNIEGNVTQLNNLDRLPNFITEPENKNTTDWYLLVRNNCYIEKLQKILEENLIPYWTNDGFFMGGNIMTRLKDYEGFKLEGYKSEEKREEFKRKFGIEDFSVPFTDTNLFSTEKKWIYEAYIEKYGLEKLKEMCKWTPQILISTIHQVKGGEADNVALLLDSTRRTVLNTYDNIDDELRVLYVGVTRAKKNLFLIDSTSKYGYNQIIEVIKDENGLQW